MATVTEEVPPQNMARNVQLYTTFSEVMQVGEQAAASQATRRSLRRRR
jgi:hypothetical protein